MSTRELTEELRAFLAGYAGAGGDLLLGLPRGRWPEAAAAERMRRLSGLVAAFSPALLAALEGGRVDADALVDELRSTTAPRSPSWEEAPAPLREALTTIAHRELRSKTLEVRNCDGLDFHDVGVVGLRCALLAAYELGWRDE